MACEPAMSQVGFDEAFRSLGAAHCQGPDAVGAWPLLLCNVVHYVLVHSMKGTGRGLSPYGPEVAIEPWSWAAFKGIILEHYRFYSLYCKMAAFPSPIGF